MSFDTAFFVPGPAEQVRGRYCPYIYLAYLLPIGLMLLGFFCHEPWRDEIQAWLMARDMDIPALIANAGAEGHPIGWHLIAKAFLSVGLPYASLQVFSLACGIAAAILLIRRGPFGPVVTFLLLLSPMFTLLGITARPYSLIVLLLFLHAFSFPRRMRHPFVHALLLGGLAQMHVLCLPYVGVMSLWWICGAMRSRAGWMTYLAQGLLVLITSFAVWQLIPPVDKAVAMLASRQQTVTSWFLAGIDPLALAVLLPPFALIAIWAVLLWGRHPMLMLAAAGSSLFAALVNYCVYPLSSCHWYMVLGILTALTWIAHANTFPGCMGRYRKAVVCPLACACLLSYPGGALEFHRETVLPSSNLSEAEIYVREHLAGTPTAVHTMARVCPLLRELPGKRLWNPVGRKWGTYAVFDADWQKSRNMTVAEAARVILEHCPEKRPAMIFSSPWDEAGQSGYVRVIDFSGPTAYEENLYIYLPAEKIAPAVQPPQ